MSVFQFILNGIINGAVIATCSLSFSFIYFSTRIFHLAWALVFVMASYTFYTLVSVVELPFYISLILTIILTATFSWLINKVYILFEQRGSSRNMILIVSIAILIAGTNVFMMIFGEGSILLTSEVSESFSLNKIVVTYNKVEQFVLPLTITILTLIWITKSSRGIEIRGYRDNEKLLGVLGFNLLKVRDSVFLLSGALVAVPACLLAFDRGVEPQIGMPILLNAVVAMIIGGLGNFWAPVVGGFLIGLVQALSNYYFEPKWESLVTFSILILFLIFLPKGLFPQHERAV